MIVCCSQLGITSLLFAPIPIKAADFGPREVMASCENKVLIASDWLITIINTEFNFHLGKLQYNTVMYMKIPEELCLLHGKYQVYMYMYTLYNVTGRT